MVGKSRTEQSDLRALAEARIRGNAGPQSELLQDDRSLLHELQVHQVELEMQNEALIKSRIALEVLRDRYVDLFDFAPVPYIILSQDGCIAEANFSAANELRMSRSDLVEQPFDQYLGAVDRERWNRHVAAAWHQPGIRLPNIELQLNCGDGSQFSAELHCLVTAHPDGSTTMRIAMFDTTERSAAAEEMQRLAYYDSLTQLPNRRLFQDRLQHAVATGKRNGLYGAVLFLDLDDFKTLNDTYGHDAGDRVLTEIADRLRHSLREGDTVARIGGDEFVMILEGLATSEEAATDLARQVGEKLNRVIADSYAVDNLKVQCAASIGVRLFGPGEKIDDLLRQADEALYQAKRGGRNRVQLFDEADQELPSVPAPHQD